MKPTPEQIAALVDAVWQILDDMGGRGTACCQAAKADLRIAYEPFTGDHSPMAYSLNDARKTVEAIEMLERKRT